MTLYEQWKELIENQTEETFEEFWEEYYKELENMYGGDLGDL